jgi:hypothetical protein
MNVFRYRTLPERIATGTSTIYGSKKITQGVRMMNGVKIMV